MAHELFRKLRGRPDYGIHRPLGDMYRRELAQALSGFYLYRQPNFKLPLP